MSIRIVFLAIALTTMSIFAHAQHAPEINDILNKQNIQSGSDNDLYFLCRESIEHDFHATEFINSEFTDAQFIDSSNKLYTVKARYNIKQNEMQILFHNKIYILYPHLIQAIQINKTIFSPLMIQTGETDNYVYLKASVIGKMSLFEKINSKNKSNQTSVYVKDNNGNISKTKTNRKSVLTLFTSQKEPVERFVIEKNLTYTNLDDLKQIFTFYNSLVTTE